jgi:phosphoribosylformylglycinamidine cyclo-ligase
MPDVFEEGAWEVVGALFTAAETPTEGQEGFELGGLSDLQQPALVFSMDGVGTKTKIGVAAGRTGGLALDLIHHSLDDILCQGARGVGFMLYLGCSRREQSIVEPVIEAARECCRSNGMVLLDCLVEEKPRLYRPGEIDLCGAVVGAVDARRLIQGNGIRPGDLLLGLPSSGLHTNGYSLARKSLLVRAGLELDHHLDELGCTVGEALLEPHRNYSPHLLPLLAERETARAIEGIAHITGGGLPDNLERILPAGVSAEIRLDSWQPPAIFDLIRRSGNIPLQDPEGKGMYESFNMGIGLVLVVDPGRAERIRRRLRGSGLEAVAIGRVLGSDAGAGPRAGKGERVVLL